MSDLFKTNPTRIAQLCYYDEIKDNWIPVDSTNPLPVAIVSGGGGGGPTSDVNLQKIGGTLQSAGNVVDGGNQAFRVNVVAGGVAQDSTLAGVKTQTDKLRFDTSSNLEVKIATPPQIFGTVRQYTNLAIPIGGITVTFIRPAASFTVVNTNKTNNGQVSFDGGVNWLDLLKNYGSVSIDSNGAVLLQLASVRLRASSGTIDVEIVTVET